MQVEADDQRHILADHLAHARQNFAFAVVEMLGHHRAVQIEIDRIERAGGRDAVDHHFGDALEGIPGDMGARDWRGGDRRHQFPAIGFGVFDKAGESDIDVAHDLEDIGARVIAGQPPPCTKSS